MTRLAFSATTPGRDPQAVEHERQERQHHEHDADDPPARVLRGVDRAGRRAPAAAAPASTTANVGG